MLATSVMEFAMPKATEEVEAVASEAASETSLSLSLASGAFLPLRTPPFTVLRAAAPSEIAAAGAAAAFAEEIWETFVTPSPLGIAVAAQAEGSENENKKCIW
jgi:hypothetical protein